MRNVHLGIFLAALVLPTLASAIHRPLRNAEPCPHGCRCTTTGGRSDRHRWHRLLAAYRTRRIVYGDHSRSSRPPWRPSPKHHQEGREMTCLGLSTMPDYIPADINKVTLYGDSKSYDRQQEDGPFGGLAPSDGNDWSRRDRLSGGRAGRKYHQLTAISKFPFRRVRGLAEVSIEGNRIKTLHASDFDLLSSMERLMLRNNRIKVVWAGAFRGLGKLETLDLSKNHLRRLPKGVFYDLPSLRKLLLNRNRLRGLHTRLFRRLPQLETLDVSDNNIRVLHNNIFQNNRRLRELVVDNNHLVQVQAELFRHTPQLTKLSLRGNHIGELMSNVFSSVSGIRSLSLDKNKITSVPRDIFTRLGELQALSLANNNISSIAEGAFANASKLQNLDLSDNLLSELDNHTFGGLTALDTLSLARNQLFGVNPKTMEEIRHLTHLDLSHNKIKTIRTRNFYGLLELRELKLDHNEIRVIEDEGFAVSLVNTYSKITWLYLQYNQLDSVTSRMLYGLSYLKFLNLCHNDIGHIEEGGLSMIGRLHTFVINDNRIDHIDVGTFKHMRHVRHMNMASNSLRNLAFNVFQGLHHLEDLNLQDNPIHDIPIAAFQDTPMLANLNLKRNKLRLFDLTLLESSMKLKYLDLSRNAISKLRMPSTFSGNLHLLSLADNNLRSIQKKITRTLSRGASLHLYGNPWSCDCHIAWMKQVHEGRELKLPESDEIVCKSPSSLSGEQVLSLRQEDLQCWSRDQISPSRSEPPSVSCSFLGHAEHTNTRKHVKARKADLMDWYATFLNPNHTLRCTGVLMSRDWILTPSICWKSWNTNTKFLLRVGFQSESNEAREVTVDRVDHYAGSLDVAMVHISAAPDAVTERNFPCVLSERGALLSLRKRAHGILQTLRRRRAAVVRSGPSGAGGIVGGHSVKNIVRSYPFRVVDSPTSGARVIRVRGTPGRMPTERADLEQAPFFVKVGISKWAFVGFSAKSATFSLTDTLVGSAFPAIAWIDRLLY